MNQPEAMVSLYTDAIRLARNEGQTLGTKSDYYITLEQLERLIKPYVEIKFDDKKHE